MEPWRAELYHYGVKGMKWGVRKDRRQSGSKPRKKGEWKQKVAKAVKYHAKATLLGYQQYRKAQGTFVISNMFGVPLSSPAINSYVNIGKDYIDGLHKLREERDGE